MSEVKLPAVRLPSTIGHGGDGNGNGQDAVVVDLPPATKFGFAYPSDGTVVAVPPPILEPPTSLSSSESDTDFSEVEEGGNLEASRGGAPTGDSEETPTNKLGLEENPLDAHAPPPLIPRLSRAFSMPVASQLGHLKNPRRVASTGEPSIVINPIIQHVQPDISSWHELSVELADSVQMVIQTLLQLSPPQVLDPAKEQFSACSLSIPTTSVSAMFTSMKNLNYMSAHMATFTTGLPSPPTSPVASISHSVLSPQSAVAEHNEFDIAEMLQSVGDALSGVAGEAGVDLVLYHGDVGLKHVSVKGDECGISYTISHIVRQVISTARPGDSVELGLFIQDQPVADDGDAIRCLRCTIDVGHKFASGAARAGTLDSPPMSPPPVPRAEPQLDSHVLRRLLNLLDASLATNLPPKTFPNGRACELSLIMECGDPSTVNSASSLNEEQHQHPDYPNVRIANEPTLEELSRFAETLAGKRVVLYASSKGSFAHHLSSYLTAWGMDVSHVSEELGLEGASEQAEDVRLPPLLSESLTRGLFGPSSSLATPPIGVSGEAISAPPPIHPSVSPNIPATTPSVAPQAPPAFIFIDDDVDALRDRLRKLRPEQISLHIGGRNKRPSLAANHRPRSSPHVARSLGLPPQHGSITPSFSSVIVHFTSLSNYKLVKDVLQSVLHTPGGSHTRLPEVIVIPKPAGPRRFLTALHTAVTKPVVDPFFAPIATSPMSPSLSVNPFFSYTGTSSPNSPPTRPTGVPRTTSDRSGPRLSPKDMPTDHSAPMAPPSPLGMPDKMEYFADAVDKVGEKLGTSPSQGVVIQSPNGLPAGIFFHPKPRGPTRQSTFNNTDRERNGLIVAKEKSSGRASSSRRSSGGYTTRAERPPINRRTTHATTIPEVPSPAGPTVTVDTATPPPKADTPQARPIGPLTPLERQSESFNAIVSSAGMQVISPETAIPPSALPYRPPRRSTGSSAGSKVSTPPISPRTDGGPPSSSSRRALRRPAKTPPMPTPVTMAGTKTGKVFSDNKVVPPISVLVVEDNPINQNILTMFLKRKKIKYDSAKNGQEAVQKWRTGGFHLILMDIQMPVMDGITATKEIRRLEKAYGSLGPGTPQSETDQATPSDAASVSTDSRTPYRSSVIIVALTASSLQSDRVAALAAGCNDFLTKPVGLDWLNNKIIEWGSIKALQIWADLRPEVVKSISRGQAVQARTVASKLHVPPARGTPDSRSRDASPQRRDGEGSASDNTLSGPESSRPADSPSVPLSKEKSRLRSPTSDESDTMGTESGDKSIDFSLPGVGKRTSSATATDQTARDAAADVPAEGAADTDAGTANADERPTASADNPGSLKAVGLPGAYPKVVDYADAPQSSDPDRQEAAPE